MSIGYVLQGLKSFLRQDLMSELKLRPPKESE
jgi:hypothetical protein